MKNTTITITAVVAAIFGIAAFSLLDGWLIMLVSGAILHSINQARFAPSFIVSWVSMMVISLFVRGFARMIRGS